MTVAPGSKYCLAWEQLLLPVLFVDLALVTEKKPNRIKNNWEKENRHPHMVLHPCDLAEAFLNVSFYPS